MATSFKGFQSLIEHSPDAISLIDGRGEILYGSASTTKIFGYQPEDLVGRNCLELIHPEDRDHSKLALKQVLAKPPGPLQWDARIRHKDGNYSWVESTVSNLLLESEVRAIVVQQRNIDARRAAEVERQRDADELARCNARLEEFAYTAAHDLQEPLRAISAYTELLVQETPLDEKSRRMAKFIVDGAARMSTLIDDLLAFASTGIQEQPRLVELRNAVEQAMENLAVDIRASGATISVGPLPVLPAVEIHLVRLFQNLIGNAVKYRRSSLPRVDITAEQAGADWIIRIQDNGIGIAEENQARVFLPFIRLADRDVPGTGLGLSAAKKIVEGMGGTIQIDSALGAGSTFSFTIVAAERRVPFMMSTNGAVI